MKSTKKEKSVLNKPGKALAGYLGAGAVSKIIGILTTPIFTRMLGSEEYGKLAFYLSSSGVIAGVVSPLVCGSHVFGILNKYKNDLSKIYLSGLLPIFAICSAICILFFTFSKNLQSSFAFFLLLIFQVFLDSAVLFYITAKRYGYNYKAVTLITLTEALLSPILSLILIRINGSSYINRVIGLLIPPLLITAVIVVKAIISGATPSKEYTMLILKEGAPLMPVSLIGAIYSQADRLMTAFLLGNAAIAKYSVAHSLGAGLLFAVTAISSSLIPWMIRKLNNQELARIGEVNSRITVGLCCLCVFLIALSPEALSFLAPAEYSEALVAVMPIALSVVFSFIYSVGSSALIHKRKHSGVVICKLISLSTALLSGVLLIPSLGYLGAGLSVLISEATSAFITFLSLNKIGSEAILGQRKYFVTSSLLFLIGVVIPFFYSSLSLRILILNLPSVILISLFTSSKNLVFEKNKNQINLSN